jgi:hypothetical protein
MIKYLAIGGLAYLAYRNAQAPKDGILARMPVIDPSYDPTRPFSVIALVRHRGQCFIVPMADSPHEVNEAMLMPDAEINAALAAMEEVHPDLILFPSCPSKAQAPAALEAWVQQMLARERYTQEAYVPAEVEAVAAEVEAVASPSIPQLRIVEPTESYFPGSYEIQI